jgi:hypothetical protein
LDLEEFNQTLDVIRELHLEEFALRKQRRKLCKAIFRNLLRYKRVTCPSHSEMCLSCIEAIEMQTHLEDVVFLRRHLEDQYLNEVSK